MVRRCRCGEGGCCEGSCGEGGCCEGGCGEGGCSLSVGTLAVVEKVAVVGVVEKVVVVVEMRLVQNNDSKRKILPQRSQPGHTNNSL